MTKWANGVRGRGPANLPYARLSLTVKLDADRWSPEPTCAEATSEVDVAAVPYFSVTDKTNVATCAVEGTAAGQPRAVDCARQDVVTCALDDTVGAVRARRGVGVGTRSPAPAFIEFLRKRLVFIYGLVRMDA